jgi:hypothetical protein
VVHWKPDLLEWTLGRAILITFDTKDLISIQQRLASLKFRIPIAFESPSTSLSSTKDTPRTSVRAFLQQRVSSQFETRLSCKEFASLLAGMRCTVGLEETYLDKAALLVDLTDWEAIHEISHLCDDILPVNSKTAIIHSDITSVVWSGILSDKMRNSPQCCALKIRWRPSYHGGRPWAQPAATTTQIQAVKKHAADSRKGKPRGSGKDWESSITTNSNLGAEPAALLEAVMGKIGGILGLQLLQKPEGEELQVNQWCMLLGPETQAPTGRLRIRLKDEEAVRVLDQRCHTMPITIGNQSVAIQVSNLAITKLPKCLGNERGTLLRGTAPPQL